MRQLVYCALTLMAISVIFGFPEVSRVVPTGLWAFLRGLGILAAAALWYGAAVAGAFRFSVRFLPERRKTLEHLAVGALAAPAAVLGAAYLKRDNLTYREVDISIKGLPKDLVGLRIVQVSDLHLSPLVSEALVARAIDMANGTRANVAVMTGDLISIASDPLDVCLRQVARLRADAGIYGCLGNHEEFAEATDYCEVEGAKLGIQFLRGRAVPLTFGGSRLNLAGVDYQTKRRKYLVGAERMIAPGIPNILLSHNPDVFPVAASQGYDLTLSGHTHGGQVNFEVLHRNLNVVQLITPYVSGLYRRGDKSIFVTRGVGTIGVPVRWGALPEVALIRLCAI